MASNQANLKNARKQLDAEMAMQHATQSALDASVASGQRGAPGSLARSLKAPKVPPTPLLIAGLFIAGAAVGAGYMAWTGESRRARC